MQNLSVLVTLFNIYYFWSALCDKVFIDHNFNLLHLEGTLSSYLTPVICTVVQKKMTNSSKSSDILILVVKSDHLEGKTN